MAVAAAIAYGIDQLWGHPMGIVKSVALKLGALILGAGLVAGSAAAAEITGAGATFPYPLYSKWAESYKAKTSTGLNYQAIGSGGGVKQIKAKTVTFGATDNPLKKDALAIAGLVQFPTVMGGIVPVVNLKGIGPNKMVLDGPTLADIYAGKIKTWNDPAITKLNPGLTLPAAAIATVWRSDASGTNFNFTYYLSQVSDSFKSSIGSGNSVKWPSGIGAKGNDGVAATVKQTANSIGFVEYAYAKQNNVAYTKMVNAAGNVVSPEVSTFTAAAASADWSHAVGFYLILANQKGAQAWPMTAATFILVEARPSNPAATLEALKFFDWAYANGDGAAKALDYVPMPAAVKASVRATWLRDVTVGTDNAPLYKSAQ